MSGGESWYFISYILFYIISGYPGNKGFQEKHFVVSRAGKINYI